MGEMTFGSYLRDKRVEAGKSLRQLAAILGCSHVYLGEVERGKERYLPENYWEKLCEAIPGIEKSRLASLKSASTPISRLNLNKEDKSLLARLARKLEAGNDDAELRAALDKILKGLS